jgi:hypothetical protein
MLPSIPSAETVEADERRIADQVGDAIGDIHGHLEISSEIGSTWTVLRRKSGRSQGAGPEPPGTRTSADRNCAAAPSATSGL